MNRVKKAIGCLDRVFTLSCITHRTPLRYREMANLVALVDVCDKPLDSILTSFI